MVKRKADALNQPLSANGSKKDKRDKATEISKPSLVETDSASSDAESVGGAKLEEPTFRINEEYAKRFEHNKKREELHRLQEKYQKPAVSRNGQYGDKYDDDASESSNDTDEDDDGFLATEALDAEISATLQAIRSKDPRVYDDKVTFYAPIQEDAEDVSTHIRTQKPMYLRDYHREKLLKGDVGASEDEAEDETVPRSFAQEQDDLKNSIIKEMHTAADGSSDAEFGDEDRDFLVPKSKPELLSTVIPPARVAQTRVQVDVTAADIDPETFLSNFMEARAWLPGEGARFQPLESDDEEEDERAEKFEAAYNLRFEDPKGSNEMLKSFARDVVAVKSVRREEPNSRKKQRDAQKEKREAERKEREEEKARLRRLKIDEMEEKFQKVKNAAGMRGRTFKDEEWSKFFDDAWDDNSWAAEMNKRFGEDYYTQQEVGSDSESDAEEGNEGNRKRKKAKKPKWDDDIDINDLIPGFEEEAASNQKPAFTLSDSEEQENRTDEESKKSKSNKDRQQEKLAQRKAARIERKKIEELVDSHLDLDVPSRSKQPTRFRYRETSPTSFGLTARDILMAPDASLNQFVGLKKMAAFRDVEKKRRDKKKLGKKARLRQWRKETFGNEHGPQIVIGENVTDLANAEERVEVAEGKRKKKRSRKNKGHAAAVP